MSSEDLRPGDDFFGNRCRQLRGLILEKRCESVEVGQRIVRLLDAVY